MQVSGIQGMVTGLLILFMSGGSPASELPLSFFRDHCVDCHEGGSPEGGVNLESPQLEWKQPSTSRFWEKVLAAIEDGRMPPEDASQPGMAERQKAARELHAVLQENVRPGGTVLRRLNRAEYESTIRDVLKVPFVAPPSFPADAKSHGFNNIGEGLILSPPLMEQYFLVATDVADLVIPPFRPAVDVKAETVSLKPDDFSVNFEGSKVQSLGGQKVLRLVTKNEVLVRSSTWPTRFEAQHSGEYVLSIKAGVFKPVDDQPFKLRLLAFKSTSGSFTSVYGLRELGEVEIPVTDSGSSPVTVRKLSVELEKGETIAFYWANSDFGWDRDGRDEAARQLRKRLTDPRKYAAWLKMGFDRGRTPTAGWKQMKELINGSELDLKDPRLAELPKRFSANNQNQLMWLFEVMHHEVGPALDLHSVVVTGPTRLIEDTEARQQRQRTERFLGQRDGRSDQDYATDILSPFLDQAFRRPPTKSQVKKYVDIALKHHAEGHRFEDGIHLAIRAALCSTGFLYRGTTQGKLDDYDLASRLSYFLWGSPPDAALRKSAATGNLSDPVVLEDQTRRLLKDRRAERFLKSFVDQWLDLELLPEIMPDPRLLKFTDKDLQAITAETRMFVEEILRENHPLETFIDPGFTYLNSRNAKLYGIKDVTGDAMQRMALKKNGRFGGILGQASVMMATANGVDTQPVLRGVWLLENVFGETPPPPPSSVPAIEPDTSGATSIRDLLSRHQADTGCAQCHRRIDPLGFALENFDPVGRWRDHYPVYRRKDDGKVVKEKGQQVDPRGLLPDGAVIHDITSLKRYLVDNVDQFAACLAGKLLVYGTGRELNYADRQITRQLATQITQQGKGFRDLIVAVVLSESFRTK